MAHSLIRAVLVPRVLEMIAEKHGVSEDEAMKLFYNSATAESLCDDETGLYGQSALYIFSEFESEETNRSRSE
ncbi:MAG: hypothetical protein LBC28_01910 [Oscillospiraceae bacterium]|nr:hypothetical protein [Oscillospiraceae bacterium]